MYFFLLIEEFLSRIITNGSWKTALFICSICRSENRSLGRWLKATMQISALGGSKHMGTQVLLALAPKCFWAMVHVNIKSRYTMFLPTVSLFRIRERLFYQEKNQHVLISVSAFFFLLHEYKCSQWSTAEHVTLNDTFSGWKGIREADNFLTCHLWCAFQAGDSIYTIIPKQLLGSCYQSFIRLLCANIFSLKEV